MNNVRLTCFCFPVKVNPEEFIIKALIFDSRIIFIHLLTEY